MFKSQNATITELHSVIVVKPPKSEKRKKYGKYVPKYQLIYKLSGEVITHFNKKTLRILPEMVYIIPKCNNADYYVERPKIGKCIDIFFNTDVPLTDELICVDFSSNKKIYDMFQKVYDLWALKPNGYYYKALSIVYNILHEMVLKSEKYVPSNNYKKIEEGIKYIKNHLFDKNMDYYLPAKLCNISYTYFKKLFIENFGIPPVQYVTSMRLEHSKELLLTNQYSVSETALLSGFENVYYFSKKFKEKYLYAPTVYKKRSASQLI